MEFLGARGHQVEFLDEPYGRSMFSYKKPTLRNFISRHGVLHLDAQAICDDLD